MKKDINNITEELIMRYVEGKMSHQESKSFEDILNKNDYLKERVDVFQNIFINQPEQSPSMSAHNDILKKLNILLQKKLIVDLKEIYLFNVTTCYYASFKQLYIKSTALSIL